MNNQFLPLYFFLIFLNIKKDYSSSILLFATLYLDFIVYNLPFVHTSLMLIFYFINTFFKSDRHLKTMIIKVFLNTLLYLGIISIFYQNNQVVVIFIQTLWNILLASCFYQKGKIELKKPSILNK